MKKLLSSLFVFGFIGGALFTPIHANGYDEAQQHINEIKQEQQNMQSFNTLLKYGVFAVLGLGIVSAVFSSKKHSSSSRNTQNFNEQQLLFEEQQRQNEQIFREQNQQFYDQLNRDAINASNQTMSNMNHNNNFPQM